MTVITSYQRFPPSGSVCYPEADGKCVDDDVSRFHPSFSLSYIYIYIYIFITNPCFCCIISWECDVAGALASFPASSCWPEALDGAAVGPGEAGNESAGCQGHRQRLICITPDWHGKMPAIGAR